MALSFPLCLSFFLMLFLRVAGSVNVNPPVDAAGRTTIDSQTSLSLDNFIGGLLASLYVIIISELGDKTFFIAAVMSMQHSRCSVYAGAMSALATMTVLSAILGYATNIIPRVFTFYCSGVLFLVFGVKMLYDAYRMSPMCVQEDYDEVKLQLSQSPVDLETGRASRSSDRSSLRSRIREDLQRIFSPILLESFILTFLAEWGDRSQITTIALAATKSVAGVIVGSVLGHALCTGVAVLVGRFVAQRIPVKWLTYVGGATFLLFAVFTFLGNPDSNS
ncbi:unnamed protein product [Dicrocoelium dendriticum]|nr:unnamed protein product [Dicrocoelium dendriticum]